tara:strand:+ start:802 stop:1227 length:426 start_codon:yes stop_codon:yes gene_type:complete
MPNKPKDIFKHINMHGGNKDECWEWKGRLNPKDGRPYFTINGLRRPSYAIVLEATTGEAQEDRIARHNCDNPICCNPYHLVWGDHQDNMNDMKERERHGLPKIVVKAIKKLIEQGKTQSEIAELYGISRETVSSISTGRRT